MFSVFLHVVSQRSHQDIYKDLCKSSIWSTNDCLMTFFPFQYASSKWLLFLRRSRISLSWTLLFRDVRRDAGSRSELGVLSEGMMASF